MKIAIDVRLARGVTGMGKYLSELLKRLTTDSKYDFYYLDYQLPRKNLLEKIFDQIYEQFWIQVLVPGILKREKIDLLYSPNPPTSWLTSVPVVLTIPDLLFYLDPNLNWFIKGYLYWVYRLSAIKATKIITFSEYSKRNIVDILKIRADKIEVISPCIKEEVFGHKINDSQVLKVKTKFGIKKNYFLNIPGTFVARKNVNEMLLSFKNLPPEVKKDFQLVFIGNDKHLSFEDFIQEVKELKLENDVIATGYISEDELVALYQGAFALVVTAIYEGFALPPLEAMRKGVPVIAIAEGASSLSEILGQERMIVSSTADLTKAIQDLIINNNLRRGLIKKGLIQAKKYNWEKAIEKINQILKTFESKKK